MNIQSQEYLHGTNIMNSDKLERRGRGVRGAEGRGGGGGRAPHPPPLQFKYIRVLKLGEELFFILF